MLHFYSTQKIRSIVWPEPFERWVRGSCWAASSSGWRRRGWRRPSPRPTHCWGRSRRRSRTTLTRRGTGPPKRGTSGWRWGTPPSSRSSPLHLWCHRSLKKFKSNRFKPISRQHNYCCLKIHEENIVDILFCCCCC